MVSFPNNNYRNQASTLQYKKIIVTLSVLYVDKNYRFIDDVLYTYINLDKADFTLSYSNADQWSNTYDVEIKMVDPLALPVAGTNERSSIIVVEQRTQVLDANLLKRLLSDFEQKSKIKSQEYSKFFANKKALMRQGNKYRNFSQSNLQSGLSRLEYY